MTQIDQGYSIYEQIFERSEMMHALAELGGAAMDRTKAGARHVLPGTFSRCRLFANWLTIGG